MKLFKLERFYHLKSHVTSTANMYTLKSTTVHVCWIVVPTFYGWITAIEFAIFKNIKKDVVLRLRLQKFVSKFEPIPI